MINYVTSVVLPAHSAQTHQILSTVKGIMSIGEPVHFYYPTRGDSHLDSSYSKPKDQVFLKGRIKYIEFLARMLLTNLVGNRVYTRDILVALLFLLRGKLVVYEAHQLPSRSANFILRILKRSSKFKVAVISQALSRYFVAELEFPDSKIGVIRSGVDVGLFREAKATKNFDRFRAKQEFVLVHSGSINEARGAKLFQQIIASSGDVRIVHVGGSEAENKKLAALVSSDRLSVLGYVPAEELPAIQKGADALLFPMTSAVKTAWCCSPMKIFEYAAARRPLIATSPGAVKELLNDENAFMVDECNASQVIKAIEAIKANPGLAELKANRLFELACEWDWSNRARKIVELYAKKD